MADWHRLGEHVVARRVALGYKTRTQLAEASGISTRILGDIETGRRGRFDPKTLAALENTLGWATGSANRVANGEQPAIVATVHESVHVTDSVSAHVTRADEAGQRDDAALVKVMHSNLSDTQKRKLVRILVAEREAAERRRVEHAEELIQLVDGEP